jgi:hypothetical protein
MEFKTREVIFAKCGEGLETLNTFVMASVIESFWLVRICTHILVGWPNVPSGSFCQQ